ncbi:MAG: hypothetical protein K0S48_12 [Ramlibacter sp.]|jgi:hypothetical protein|nr:hypothetical protein [Ramlibacter sp.]
MTAVAYALQLMTALPQLIQAGVEVTKMVTSASEALQRMEAEGRDPTPAEWATLNAEITRLRGELHAG